MSTFTNEFETDFYDDNSATRPISQNGPSFYIADLSNDFSDTTVKDERYMQFPSSQEYKTMRFSSYPNDGRRFVGIDEGILYLREIMEYDVLSFWMVFQVL